MKTTIVAATLLFFSVGCASPRNERLTQRQAEQIRSEVKATQDSIIARWVRLNGKGAMEYYAPGVVIVYDSLRMDYQAYRQGWMAYDSAAAAVRIRPLREDFLVLTRDVAIATWVGHAAYYAKSGDTVTTDPQIYSNVLMRVAGRWMVVFSNPSGVDVLHKAVAARRPRR